MRCRNIYIIYIYIHIHITGNCTKIHMSIFGDLQSSPARQQAIEATTPGLSLNCAGPLVLFRKHTFVNPDRVIFPETRHGKETFGKWMNTWMKEFGGMCIYIIIYMYMYMYNDIIIYG